MVAISSLLIVLTISLLVNRVATMALMLTGMSRESARFQARSAFTGVGYTTTEAEDIVGHPVRRRIVMILMLLGNLGIGAVVATLMVSFMSTTQREVSAWDRLMNLSLLALGLLLLWIAANSQWVEKRLNRVISWALRKWAKLEVRDYVAVLQLQGGFAVSELRVAQGDWLCDKTLIELRLPSEGVLVLGVQRPGEPYVGAPQGETRIAEGDNLILYGRVERIGELDQRRRGRKGDAAHQEAVEGHELEKSQTDLKAYRSDDDDGPKDLSS